MSKQHTMIPDTYKVRRQFCGIRVKRNLWEDIFSWQILEEDGCLSLFQATSSNDYLCH